MRKTAFVTGSTRGIGRAIAKALEADGYKVFIHGKNRISGGLWGDLTKDEDLKRIFIDLSKKTDKLDLLVNNAGFDYGYLIKDYKMEEVKYLVDLNLTAKIAVTKLALPLLKKANNPVIVNIASRMGGSTTIKTVGPYAAAEAGVIKFTQCAALEFAPKIRVNCVAPGMTKTELALKTYSKEDFKIASQSNPLKRVAKPEDIANVVSFLASDKASYINGETILVTGGSNLK